MEIKSNDRIVVIGGGFGGLRLIQELRNKPVWITLIDKQNFHTFQPLLYQVASARIEPASISFPFRKLFQKFKNVDFLMSEVLAVDTEKKLVVTKSGEIGYDQLVIASGCTTNFFGNSELKKHALAMKEMSEAIRIRNNVLLDFEHYELASLDEKERLKNIIIVGAGATGVELAGAFAELKNDLLPKDFPKLDFSDLRIILLEGSPHTLNNMSYESKKMSRLYLEKLGVTVKTNVLLKSYDGNNAVLSNGEVIACKNLIWAAGVSGNVIEGVTTEENIIRNRYVVNRYNEVKGASNIFAIGDVAYMETPLYPKGHPQVANVAINQGNNLARNILRFLSGKPLVEYEYRDMGMMATIGNNKAVVDLKHLKFKGFWAWMTWMFLHLMLILGVRNKVVVFINWAWIYVTKNTSLRLIINPKTK